MDIRKMCRGCGREICPGDVEHTVIELNTVFNYCAICLKQYEKHSKQLENPNWYDGKIKVAIKPEQFPVKYNGAKHFEGEEFYIDPADFREDIFEKVN